MTQSPTGGRVLVVCTGNVCRSAYLERMLRLTLGPEADVVVTSAGTHALVGNDMEAPVAALLSSAGADPTGFTARQLTADLVAEADLVVTAAREHAAAVARLDPRALRCTVPLAQLSALLRDAPADEVRAARGDTTAARVAVAALARRGTVATPIGADADLADPYRQPTTAFEAMAATVGAALPPLVAALRVRTD